jgi:thioredoxin-dependent peroxiredoxin
MNRKIAIPIIPVFFFISIVPIIIFAKEDKMLLTVGSTAPDFTLKSSSGDTVSLHDFTGKNSIVLIFYPGDETPGCTKQLCAIRDDYSQFQNKNAKVFGVNPADLDSHRKFVEHQRFQFPLLIDENREVAKLYGCDIWPIVKRTVYVIDAQGKIVYAKRGMPDNTEILAAIPLPPKE